MTDAELPAPRLKLETRIPARHRAERPTAREVTSGCTVEEEDSPRDGGAYRAVEEAAQKRLDVIEASYQRMIAYAVENDTKAAKARGMHIRRRKENAQYAREYAEKKSRHPEKPLPKAANADEKPEPFAIYVDAPPEYENTLIMSAFDSEGFEILSMRVTGATSVRAAALERAWELVAEMKPSADPTLTLVRN